MRDFQNRSVSGSPSRSRGPGNSSRKKSASRASNDRRPLGMTFRGRLSESRCATASVPAGTTEVGDICFCDADPAETASELAEGRTVREDAGLSAPNNGSNRSTTPSSDNCQASIRSAVDRSRSRIGPGATSSSRTRISRFCSLRARSTALTTCGEPPEAPEMSTTQAELVSIPRRIASPELIPVERSRGAIPTLTPRPSSSSPSRCAVAMSESAQWRTTPPPPVDVRPSGVGVTGSPSVGPKKGIVPLR